MGRGPRGRGARQAAAIRGGDRLRERRAAGDRGRAAPLADPDGGGPGGGARAPHVAPDVARRALVGPLRAGEDGGARARHERRRRRWWSGPTRCGSTIDAVAAALDGRGRRRGAHAVRARGLRARARGGSPAARRPPGGERRRPGRGGHPGGACPGPLARGDGRRRVRGAGDQDDAPGRAHGQSGPDRRRRPERGPDGASPGGVRPARGRDRRAARGRRARRRGGSRADVRPRPGRRPVLEPRRPPAQPRRQVAPAARRLREPGLHPDEHPRVRGRPGPARRGPRLRDLLARARGERGGRGEPAGAPAGLRTRPAPARRPRRVPGRARTSSG